MIETVYIVNHTHWDREWYRSFDEYLIRLRQGVIYLIDMLDNNEIENFYFDGQTIIIEDLEGVLPKQYFEKFISYIEQGIIEIGPCYILPDESLISGEDFINNIEIGSTISKKYNQTSDILYMADTFGHISQLPQIASGFNIDSTLIHRGALTNKSNVKWQGADNTKVNAIVLPLREGYYQTMFHLPANKFIEGIRTFINSNLDYVNENSLLLLNGCDHTFIPEDFSLKIDMLKNEIPEIDFKQVTLSEYIKNTSFNDEVIQGEQRETGKAFLLPGVLSTRVYLKQSNQLCSDKIKYFAEPISLLIDENQNNDASIVKNIKRVVKNLPHDSICGCSIDKVHTEMEVRYTKIEDSLNSIIDVSLNEVSPYLFSDFESEFNNIISIYNHLPSNIRRVVNVEIMIPTSLVEDKNINILGAIDFNINSCVEEEVLLHKYNVAPSYQQVKKYNCDVIVDLEALSFKDLEIEIIEDKQHISNEVVEINDEILSNFKGYKYVTDIGDSYNFSPIGELKEAKLVSTSTIKNIFSIETTLIHEIVEFEELDDTRTKRCGNEIKQTITTKITKSIYSEELKFETNYFNELKNIKIVAVFEKVGKVFSDTAFDLIERKKINEIIYEASEVNGEVVYNQFPSLTSVVNGNMQISHIGLTELEVLEEEIHLTILRATDSLSRRDLKARKGGAGPSYEAIGNQVLRDVTCQFNLKQIDKFDPYLHLLNYPFKYHQGSKEIAKKMPFEILGDVAITRIKRHDNKLVVRFFNYNDVECDVVINTDAKVSKVNLNYEIMDDVNNKIKVLPKEIVTLMIGEL